MKRFSILVSLRLDGGLKGTDFTLVLDYSAFCPLIYGQDGLLRRPHDVIRSGGKLHGLKGRCIPVYGIFTFQRVFA